MGNQTSTFSGRFFLCVKLEDRLQNQPVDWPPRVHVLSERPQTDGLLLLLKPFNVITSYILNA